MKKEINTMTKPINKLQENVFKKEYLMPTETLNMREVELFNTIVKSMKVGFFIESDRLLIEEFIKLKQVSDNAYQQLKDYDDLSTPEGNRIVGIMAKTAGAISTISQKLSIAPSSRQRFESKTNSVEATISALDSLLD